MSDNIRGAIFMTGSMLAFILNDTLMKAMSDELPLFQVLTLRGIGAATVLLVILAVRGQLKLDFGRADRLRILVRSLAEAAGAVLYISALYRIPLANATAILQALPLMLTLAGAVFFGEKVGWKRFAAIILGFAGVMLIVRPGGAGFDRHALLAVASLFVIILRELMTRRLSATVPSLLVAASAALAAMMFGLVGSLAIDWMPVSPKAGLQLLGSVCCLMVAYFWSIQAMRVGDIAAVSPFRYTSLLFGLILGFVVFGDWPDRLTLLGALVVAASGLFTLFRERRMARMSNPNPLMPG
jgi:S-adenosylmethionine uptake transporter